MFLRKYLFYSMRFCHQSSRNRMKTVTIKFSYKELEKNILGSYKGRL